MYRFSFSGTRSIIFGTLKIGQNDPEIPNLELKITVSLKIKFSFQPNKLGQIEKENILQKQDIVYLIALLN